MRPDKFKLANEWIYGEATPMEEAKATWEAMDAEFNENRKIMLAESNPYKDNFNTPDLEQSEFLEPKRIDIFGNVIPAETLEDWDVTFRRPNAEGGMQQLVQPSVDGLRPGYSGYKKIPKHLQKPRGKPPQIPLTKREQKILDDYKKINPDTKTTDTNLRSKIRNNIITEETIKKLESGQKRGLDLTQEKKAKKAQRQTTLIKKILNENSVTKNGYKVLTEAIGSTDLRQPNTLFSKIVKTIGKDKVDQGVIKKLLDEIIKNENYLSSKDYRKQIIVDVFMDDFAKNGEFTGEAKFDPRLQEFRHKHGSFTSIHNTFKEWANGDFEVSGFDRSTFDDYTKKNLKNWKPIEYITERNLQVAKEVRFLNNLNDAKPNLSVDQVKKIFNKEFKNNKYWKETSFKNRVNILYPHKIYGEGRTAGKIITENLKGERSPWLKQAYRDIKSGNFMRILSAADVAEANGDLQLAKKYRKAAKDLFMPDKGVFEKVVGQAEHPWFHNYGKGLFQIDSIVKGDLNMFKSKNFEIPIRNLIDKYEKNFDSLKPFEKKAIESEINLRRNFLNTITDIGDGGMARNVTFDYKSNPGKIKVINKTSDIYDLYEKGKLNPLELQTRGTNYRDTLIKNLTEADYNILKKGTNEIKTQKLGTNNIKNLLQKFEAYGCNQAAGGRILFSDGSPFGKVTKCADKGIARFLNDIKTGNYTEATKRIFRSGGNLIKGVLNPMELLKLRNYFGPAALGFMAAFEAGVITDDVFRMGQPLNESLASNWLTKSFTPYSLRHAEISNLIKNNKLPSNMLQYAKDAVKFEEAKKEMERIESNQGTRVIDGSGYGFIDGTSVYTQEQEAKDVKGLTEKLSSIKDGSVIMPGSAKEMELQKLLTEKSATEMAKKGFSPIFGFGNLKDRNQTVAFDDYMSPVETPKDLRPVTYLDAVDYKDQALPSSVRQSYENFFSSPEGGNYLKPRQSLSELKYKDTNILDELTKDYNNAQRIKLASELPGFYGTQDDREFMEGGIASLNVKKK